MDNAENQIEDITAAVNQLNYDVTAVENSVTALGTRTTTLEGTAATHTTQIANLTSSMPVVVGALDGSSTHVPSCLATETGLALKLSTSLRSDTVINNTTSVPSGAAVTSALGTKLDTSLRTTTLDGTTTSLPSGAAVTAALTAKIDSSLRTTSVEDLPLTVPSGSAVTNALAAKINTSQITTTIANDDNGKVPSEYAVKQYVASQISTTAQIDNSALGISSSSSDSRVPSTLSVYNNVKALIPAIDPSSAGINMSSSNTKAPSTLSVYQNVKALIPPVEQTITNSTSYVPSSLAVINYLPTQVVPSATGISSNSSDSRPPSALSVYNNVKASIPALTQTITMETATVPSNYAAYIRFNAVDNALNQKVDETDATVTRLYVNTFTQTNSWGSWISPVEIDDAFYNGIRKCREFYQHDHTMNTVNSFRKTGRYWPGTGTTAFPYSVLVMAEGVATNSNNLSSSYIKYIVRVHLPNSTTNPQVQDGNSTYDGAMPYPYVAHGGDTFSEQGKVVFGFWNTNVINYSISVKWTFMEAY
jgi:hypothetical protein